MNRRLVLMLSAVVVLILGATEGPRLVPGATAALRSIDLPTAARTVGELATTRVSGLATTFGWTVASTWVAVGVISVSLLGMAILLAMPRRRTLKVKTAKKEDRRGLVARLRDRVLVTPDGLLYAFETGEAARAAGRGGGGSGLVTAPMPGKVIAVLVAAGDQVEAGQPLVLVEAMKMETTLAAEIAGRVRKVAVSPGQLVEGGQVLVEISA